jgi:hypothetical protein
MTTLSELIAKADKAAAGGGAPKSDKNYYLNAAKEGLAEGVGMVADVGARALSLPLAAGGYLASKVGLADPGALPELSGFANFNTNALKNMFGVEQIQPTSQGQEVVGGIIRGAASLPLPMGAGGLLAQTAKTALVGGLAGGGAVGGGQAAEAIFPDSPIAKTIGSLGGGVGAGVLLPSMGGVLGIYGRAKEAAEQAAANPAVQGAARTVAERVVDRQVKDAVSGTPNAAANITDALRLRERIGPQFNPSVAEMADSPGLSEMQRRYSLTSPQRLNQEVARDVDNVAAIKAFYEKYAGSPAQPGVVRSAVNQDLSDEAKSIAAGAEGVANKLKPADQVAIGNRASEIAEAERKAARPAINAAYQKAFDAAGDSRVEIAPVVSKVEEILGTKLAQVKPESAPQTVSAIRRLFGQSEGKTPDEVAYLSARMGGNIDENAIARTQVTLKDIDDIRKAVNADVASAQRSSDPAAGMRLRNLTQVHRAIDEAVTASKVPENAKMLYANAIQKYRNEFVPRFKEGANYQMFKDTSLNEPKIMAEKFTSSYFMPDSQGGVTRGSQFAQLFGKNQEAKDLTRNGIMDLYRQKVVNPQTGQIDMAAHNRFIRDHLRTMNTFKAGGVNVLDEIGGIGKQAEAYARMGDKLNDMAKTLKFDTASDMIDSALSYPKVMGNVLQRIGNDQRQNLQRLLMDKAWESGTGAGMQKFLTDNEKTLKMALSPQHLQDMRDVSKALAITERAPIRGTLASGGPDILKNATGVSMATVWSQYRAMSGGRQGPMTAVFNLSAPVMTKLSQTNFNDVMQKALHDPETAKSLRNFLVASGQGSANAAASNLMEKIASTAKMGAGIVWDYKGNAAKLLLGTGNYGLNAGRAAVPIAQEAQ